MVHHLGPIRMLVVIIKIIVYLMHCHKMLNTFCKLPYFVSVYKKITNLPALTEVILIFDFFNPTP